MVATGDAFHSECTVEALDRGVDVLTEKPMAIDESQCKAVLDALAPPALAGAPTSTVRRRSPSCYLPDARVWVGLLLSSPRPSAGALLPRPTSSEAGNTETTCSIKLWLTETK